MKLLSANLYNGRAKVADLAVLIEAVQPDVFVGQEVGYDAAEKLREMFPYGRLEGSDRHDGRALVAVHPIEVEDLDLPFRRGYRAAAVLDGQEIDVLGVHIANPVDGPSGIRARREQLVALASVLDGTGPCVLVGDLNSTPLWPFHRRLTDRLDDTIADWAHRTGGRPLRTWGPRPSWPAVLRIDHVLGRGITAVSHRVHRLAGCDHRAVEVDLELDR